MPESNNFDQLYKVWVEEPALDNVPLLGPPAFPSEEEFAVLLSGLKDFRQRHPDMAYWQIISLYDMSIEDNGGDLDIFGKRISTYRDFLRLVHPDYFLPMLQWRNAALSAMAKFNIKMTPMKVSYRTSMPLLTKNGQYYWFSQHSTVAQVDAEGHSVRNLHTLYLEGQWTPHSTKPFEAHVFQEHLTEHELEQILRAQIVPYFLDELTNAELDLISLYASGLSAEEVCIQKGWSKHTLHEYNASVLKKARRMFQYDFRNAKDFAAFCLERKFIYKRS